MNVCLLFVLITLHRIDGAAVYVNAQQVTSLRMVEGQMSGQVQGECVVGMTDGKFLAVLESCGEVKRLVEQCGDRRQ